MLGAREPRLNAEPPKPSWATFSDTTSDFNAKITPAAAGPPPQEQTLDAGGSQSRMEILTAGLCRAKQAPVLEYHTAMAALCVIGCAPCHSSAEVLNPNTAGCYCTWRPGLEWDSELKMRSSGWALTHWCLSETRTQHTQGEDHRRTQGEDGHPQAKQKPPGPTPGAPP